MTNHAPSNTPRTLTEALVPYALPESSFRQFIPCREVTKRFLGEDVSFYPVMALSPVAMHTHIGLFRRCFYAPFVELRLSAVTPELRQIAFVASTSTFECSYCLAHGLAFGDMLSGAMENQLRRGCPLPKYSVNLEAEHLTPIQSAVIRLAIAVSKRKHTASKGQLLPLCQNLSRLFANGGNKHHSHDVEVIKSIVCFVGALNTFMGIMGVQLEPKASAFASVRAAEVGVNFEPGIHASATHNTDSHRDSQSGGHSDHMSAKHSSVGGILANFIDFVGLVPDIIAMMALEREIYSETPTSNEALDEWVKHQLSGNVPQFMANIQRLGFKQAVCFGLQANVLRGSEHSANGDKSEVKWTRRERCGLMYVYGTVVGCEEMRVLGKKLCPNGNTSDFKSLMNNQECETKWSSGFVAAKTVVVEHIVNAENVSTETIQLIVKEFPAEGVVEVVSLISFLCFLHRVIMLFNDEEMCQ
ncbi:hypothetical protein BWQ96_07032 [Gracilariopsis chorda]|uniref:Uncharacterized protein n=1 Tax=Gracilariopsis chorda TaxID=448386 RepID=A0A2V3IMA1_9FLOR|nr:hypothetical protein BWQ96_07032 [Gracilariopsis chorda]|eukprot:PXF43203.1 hypothetical protein BWQ96_07032 [Gracilariopsis chorda]